MIIEQILVTGMAVFCYLIADETTKEGILIDPAGDFEKISQKINQHKVNIKYIINTHGHFDHTSGNQHFIEKTNAKLLIHKKDSDKLGKVLNKLLSRVTGGKGSPEPVEFLTEGDTVTLGSINLKVIHTPGHSEGSICLYIKGNIFTGDTLFTEGMGRTDLADGSMKKIMNSIKNKILTLPDDTVIWPGHHYGRFPSSTVKEQKKYYR